MGEIQQAFVVIDAVNIAEIEEYIKDIKKTCDEGYKAMERLHKQLGIYKNSTN